MQISNAFWRATVVSFGVFVGLSVGLLRGEDAAAASVQPTVLVIAVADSPEQRMSEQRFVAELKTALMRFQVQTENDPSGRFASMSLSERLALIRMLSNRHRAIATVWIERWERNKILLNLTAMSTGRAIVRIVEVKKGPFSEAELALAAEELLGEAYLLSPNETDDAVQSAVDKVTDAAISNRRLSTRKPEHSLSAFALLRGGLYERKGSSISAGGGIAWKATFLSGWFVGLSVKAFGGPKERWSDGMVTGYGIDGDISLGYYFHLKRLYVGPAMKAGFRWNRMDAVFDSSEGYQSSTVFFRGAFSLNTGIRFSERAAFDLDLDLGALPNRAEFRRDSTGQVVLCTPWLEGAILAGLRFFL